MGERERGKKKSFNGCHRDIGRSVGGTCFELEMSLLSGTCGVGFVRAVPVFFCLVSFSFFLPSPALFLYLLLISLGPGALSRGPKCPFIHDTTIKTRIPATVCVCIYISCLLSAPFDMAVDTEIMKKLQKKNKRSYVIKRENRNKMDDGNYFY